MDLQSFQSQHDAIVQGIDELRRLTHAGVAENATEIAHAIVGISSIIKVHLAAEDRVLYPQAGQCGDADIVRLAQRFQKDMGPLAERFVAFVKQWNTPQAVRKQPDAFRADANTVMHALWDRIQHENAEFYPRLKAL